MTAELFIVALTILGEARGETFEGMAGVASVIQTRMIERKQTASQVCLAPKQFSFWNGGVSEATKKKLLATAQGKNALYLAGSSHSKADARHRERCESLPRRQRLAKVGKERQASSSHKESQVL